MLVQYVCAGVFVMHYRFFLLSDPWEFPVVQVVSAFPGAVELGGASTRCLEQCAKLRS